MIFDTPNCICNKYYTGNSLTKYKCIGLHLKAFATTLLYL